MHIFLQHTFYSKYWHWLHSIMFGNHLVTIAVQMCLIFGCELWPKAPGKFWNWTGKLLENSWNFFLPKEWEPWISHVLGKRGLYATVMHQQLKNANKTKDDADQDRHGKVVYVLYQKKQVDLFNTFLSIWHIKFIVLWYAVSPLFLWIYLNGCDVNIY